MITAGQAETGGGAKVSFENNAYIHRVSPEKCHLSFQQLKVLLNESYNKKDYFSKLHEKSFL